MVVTTRNFLRLLRAGVFGRQEQLEPLSAWKWQRLYQLSLMHGVSALMADGISLLRNQFFFQMPEKQQAQWAAATKAVEEQNRRIDLRVSELASIFAQHQWHTLLFKGQALATYYTQPLHRTPGDIDFFFADEAQADAAEEWAETNGTDLEDTRHDSLKYQWQGMNVEHYRQMQQFTNVLRNRTLQQIIEKELQESAPAYIIINGTRIETAPHTLGLLLLLVRITRYLLSDGITMKQITDLAVFLRRQGNRIDSNRLADWIERLKLGAVTQLIGALVAETMMLDDEEIPFLNPDGDRQAERIIDEMFDLRGEWRSTNDDALFTPNDNSPALFRRTRHTARYFSYYPSETIASYISSLARIEE